MECENGRAKYLLPLREAKVDGLGEADDTDSVSIDREARLVGMVFGAAREDVGESVLRDDLSSMRYTATPSTLAAE